MILKVRPISQSSEEIFIVLENLSLEELWKLFPIYFVDSNAEFEQQFLDEKEYLISLLGDYVKRISHVGSTAIKNIKTKLLLIF